MITAKSGQYRIVFATEVCSFYELSDTARKQMLNEFKQFIKKRGEHFEFMPYEPQIIIEEGYEE
jgi:hypothetical protein